MRVPSLLATSLLVSAPVVAQGKLPPGFIAEPIGSSWKLPTDLAFLDETRLLVALKNGRVWYVEDDLKRNVVLDLTDEALNNGDRGLLSIALDPDFANNGYLYALLVVDPNGDGVDAEQEAFSRLVRYTTSFQPDGRLLAGPLSRVELLGADWPTGIPSCHLSHATGTIRFLSDGSLVLSHGDGAHYDLVDTGGNDPGCFSAGRFPKGQDIGAFRSVSENSLSGKVLRLDPATGLGLPDNPLFDGDPNSVTSRIWAMGLRNPFRLSLIPGTGPREALFISDVGWDVWEEVELCLGGENFGWPCWEGPFRRNEYQNRDPLGLCPGVNGVHAQPLMAWHHSDPTYASFTGTCATGVAVYQGTSYPPLYRDALFFMDYAGGWMRFATLDASYQPTAISTFATRMGGPIALEREPVTGNLVYITLGVDEGVYRLRYVGSNQPPKAVALALPAYGPAPLSVQLVGSGSTDPDNDPLTYLWDLGDGTTTTDPDPTHVYTDPTATYVAKLTVTDPLLYSSSSEVVITPGNSPPRIVSLKSPLPGQFYTTGTELKLKAKALDLEDDVAGVPLDVTWHVDLYHDHHVHPDTFQLSGEKASFTPDPHGSGTWLGVRLEVTDSRGLVAKQAFEIYDDATVPKPHIVAVRDATPRIGSPFVVTGHVEFPGNPDLGPTSLVFDWGDGTTTVIDDPQHQVDSVQSHVYPSVGAYTFKLRAIAGASVLEVEQAVDVQAKNPEIAVFVPEIKEGWISWSVQIDIANALAEKADELGLWFERFAWDEQVELSAWMNDHMDDGVPDVLVLLDFAPARAYAGEDDGSLAEEWLEHGDGIVWTGQRPFSRYLRINGADNGFGAGSSGLDDVLDPAVAGLSGGGGLQELRGRASRIPSLASFSSLGALRYEQIGAEWSIRRLYADDDEAESDAIVLQHDAGGFYAQVYCRADDSLPRADTIAEMIVDHLFAPGKAGKK